MYRDKVLQLIASYVCWPRPPFQDVLSIEYLEYESSLTLLQTYNSAHIYHGSYIAATFARHSMRIVNNRVQHQISRSLVICTK